MGSTLEQIKGQLNEFYQSMNTKQKIRIGVSIALILISMILLFYFTSRPEYVTLFQNISAKEAGEITQALDGLGISWKSGDTPNSILVAKEDYNKANMNLAVEGFPKERFSYEDFLNNSSITMTNEEKKQRYLIAQKNSLASTIEEIDGIKAAWVDLSVAEDSNFLMNNQESKASVFVELDSGRTLDEQQVNGIVALVSNAVKGLEPENISVVDNRGIVLNNKGGDSSFDASTQLTMQKQIQKDLTNSINQFLSTVYGQGNVAVMVNVALDFDSEVTEKQVFSPPVEGETNGLIRSMSDLQEKVINGASGGVPGTDTNTQDITEYIENNENASTYDKANKTINYELNQINQKIVKAQGQVRDITVAIILNKESLVDQELTDEHKEKIINLVSAASGLSTKVVEVMAQDFDTTLVDEFERAQQTKANNNLLGNIPLWSLGIIGAMLVGGVGFSIYSMRAKRKEEDAFVSDTIEYEQKNIDEIDLELSEKSEYKKQINKFVDRNPEAVAQLLKTWLNED